MSENPVAHPKAESALLVLSYLDLPYVDIRTYEDKRAGVGYAAVLGGQKGGMSGWCHNPDSTDPPFFYHRSEAEAWDCFDSNHPNLRQAIAHLSATIVTAKDRTDT